MLPTFVPVSKLYLCHLPPPPPRHPKSLFTGKRKAKVCSKFCLFPTESTKLPSLATFETVT